MNRWEHFNSAHAKWPSFQWHQLLPMPQRTLGLVFNDTSCYQCPKEHLAYSMAPVVPNAPKNTWPGYQLHQSLPMPQRTLGLVFNDTSCSRCSKENFCSSFVGAACNCCNASLRFERQAAFSQSSCAYHSFSPQLRTVSLQWTLTHKWGQADRAGVREKNIPPFKHAGAAPLASHITSLDRAVSLLVTITSDNCTAAKYNAERVSQTCSLRTEIAQPHCRKI